MLHASINLSDTKLGLCHLYRPICDATKFVTAQIDAHHLSHDEMVHNYFWQQSTVRLYTRCFPIVLASNHDNLSSCDVLCGINLCIIRQIGHCIGGNLNIHIRAWSASSFVQVGGL